MCFFMPGAGLPDFSSKTYQNGESIQITINIPKGRKILPDGRQIDQMAIK
jgi:hypothetical protein